MATAIKSLIDEVFLGFFEVFVSSDGASIRLGENWSDAIEVALKRADLILVVVSPLAVDRRWIYFESGGAYFSGKRVIPICVAGVRLEALPPPLSWLQAVDSANVTSFAQLFRDTAEFFELRPPQVNVAPLSNLLCKPNRHEPTYIGFRIRPQPIFLVLDMSGSMSGWRSHSVSAAIARFLDFASAQHDSRNPRLLSIVAFNSEATVALRLQDVSQISQLPKLQPDGGTQLGPAFELLSRELSDDTVVPAYARAPLVVLLIDGEPSDDWRTTVADFTRRFGGRTARVSVALGESGLVDAAAAFANTTALALVDPTDANELDLFFRWLSRTLVESVTDQGAVLNIQAPSDLHASRLEGGLTRGST